MLDKGNCVDISKWRCGETRGSRGIQAGKGMRMRVGLQEDERRMYESAQQ
jgi:hypothetical protein